MSNADQIAAALLEHIDQRIAYLRDGDLDVMWTVRDGYEAALLVLRGEVEYWAGVARYGNGLEHLAPEHLRVMARQLLPTLVVQEMGLGDATV